MTVRESKASYNAYQARLMRRRRFLRRVEPHYHPFRDRSGFVLVRACEYIARSPSQPLLKDKIYRLPWQVAARLEAGYFVELLTVPAPPEGLHPPAWDWPSLTPDAPRAGVQRIRATLKEVGDALRQP